MNYLINKKNTGHKLSNTLIDISADHFIDLIPQLVCDLCLLRLHELTHHTHDILPPLRPRICNIKVVQRHVLYYLFLLVHFTFGYWHVLLGF